MANVVLFNPNQYLTSVNTPEYVNNPNAIINPDVSAVLSVPVKFWKRVGDTVVEMTPAEKQAIIDAELQARKDAVTDPSFADLKDILTALVKVINIRLPIDKKITKLELIDAIKAEMV